MKQHIFFSTIKFANQRRTRLHTYIHTYIHAIELSNHNGRHSFIHTYIHTHIHTYIQLNFRITTEDTERLHIETHICEVLLIQRQFKQLQSEDKHARYIRFRNSRHRPRMNLSKYIMSLVKSSRAKEAPAATSVLPPPSDTFMHARSNTSLNRRVGPLVTNGTMRNAASLPPVVTSAQSEKRRGKHDKGDTSHHSFTSVGHSPQRVSTSMQSRQAKIDSSSSKGVLKTSFGQDRDRRQSGAESGSGSFVSFQDEQPIAHGSASPMNFWQAIKVINSSEVNRVEAAWCVHY
jgi:hypothetical protein